MNKLKNRNEQESVVISDSSARNPKDSSLIHTRDLGDTAGILNLFNQKK